MTERTRREPQKPISLLSAIRALALVLVSIASVVFLIIQGIHTFEVMRGGATTTAKVIETYDEIREEAEGRRTATITVAIYEFPAQGRHFRGSKETFQGGLSIGDTLAVTYNPKKPDQNRSKGDRSGLANYLIMAFLGGVISYSLMAAYLPDIWGFFGPRSSVL